MEKKNARGKERIGETTRKAGPFSPNSLRHQKGKRRERWSRRDQQQTEEEREKGFLVGKSLHEAKQTASALRGTPKKPRSYWLENA